MSGRPTAEPVRESRTEPKSEALLQVEDLRVELPTVSGMAQALRGVSFTVERGQTVGLIGESGCGKSMTALAVLGLLPEHARLQGSIRFAGRELTTLSDDELCRIRGDRIGVVFQEPMTALNPVHTIGQQVGEPLRLHEGVSAKAARARTIELLDRVGLPEPHRRVDAYPHQFSGGQRQRVTIAMALACDPDLLIADEPTTALDVTIQGQILELIAGLVAERGMALLLISHDLGVIAQTVQRMQVMYAGAVVESGPTASVFAAPAHPYTRGLFAARPRLGAAPGTRLNTIAGTVPALGQWPAGCAFAPRCPIATAQCSSAMPEPVPVGSEAGVSHVARCIRIEAGAQGAWQSLPVQS